ncbi:A disintegrin and metalloproteinase with thrombospondin motifs 20-like [Haliotis asinina]|uniref:A disintegrin and metalloproteinase with thrombospondin motifs 20-like n=1 Tax=Haliotis asinina TaxID=109174 RepID=UPI003532711E
MSLWKLLILRLVVVTAWESCIDLSNFKMILLEDIRLKVITFLALNNSDVLQCVKECKLRSRCQSINFSLNSQCGRMTTTQYVYSDIKSWKRTIARRCKGHSCSSRTMCREKGVGFTCLCSNPPAIRYAKLNAQSRMMWKIGEKARYECDSPFSPRGRSVCQSDGSWTDFSCVLVTDCNQVKTCNNAYGDGEYWIVLEMYKYTRVKIYCHGMSSDTPGHFVTFQEDNYSVMPSGCERFYCGRTNFYKIRINLYNLQVEPDLSFAQWSCKPGPYGRTMGCSQYTKADCGTTTVNLIGTSFKVSNLNKYDGPFEIKYSANHSVMHGICHGACTPCVSVYQGVPYKFGFSLNEHGNPDEHSALMPVCV